MVHFKALENENCKHLQENEKHKLVNEKLKTEN